MNWQDAIKLPLKQWDSMTVKVFTATDNMAFDFMFELFDSMYPNCRILSDEDKKNVIDLINGNRKGKIEGEVTYDQEKQTVNIDGRAILLIRGWGALTGTGGLNLPPETAAKFQDEFAAHIVQKLSGN